MLAEKAEQLTKKTDLYALDNWLRYLGLWKGESVFLKEDEERLAALHDIEYPIHYDLADSDYDEAGQIMVSVRSTTTYDQETGEFTDSIRYHRHLPWGNNSDGMDNGEVHVLTIRGKTDPRKSEDEVPSILPTHITVNGSTVFHGFLSGGKDNPYDTDKQRMINRLRDVSAVCKEDLRNREPLKHLYENLAFLKEMSLGAPALTGISANGDFDTELTGYFMDMVYEDGGKLTFNAETEDDLDLILGFSRNTFDNLSLKAQFDRSGTHRQSGIIFTTQVQKHVDDATDHHIYKLVVTVENPPEDMEVPPPIELVHLEFSRPNDDNPEFILEKANFMDGDPSDFTHPREQTKVMGFFQKSLSYLAEGKFPPYFNLAYQCRLDKQIRELAPPPSHETGGEMLFIPLNGADMDKQTGAFGATLGGGNLFMSRCIKPDGRWSEVGILNDMPYESGERTSDISGSQPDFSQFGSQVHQGVCFASHGHYDHCTYEYPILRGEMIGQRLICTGETWDLIYERAMKLGATKDQLPIHIDLDHPDMIEYQKDMFAYPVKDEDGIIRSWLQICRNGVEHSNPPLMMLVTPCYGDDHYGTSHLILSDTHSLKETGKAFTDLGQLGLIGLPGVNEENLRKSITNEDELYIAYHDPTNITKAGHAPTMEEFKEAESRLMTILRDIAPEEPTLVVPFSTHHLELQAYQELCNEPELLHNTTAIGTNMEVRKRLMNKYGVNPELDLRDVVIPPEKIPTAVYDAAIYGLEQHVAKMEKGLKRAETRRVDRKTAEQLGTEDVNYSVLSSVLKTAKEEREQGIEKPAILYNALMSPNTHAFEDLAEENGFEVKEEPRQMPGGIYREMKEYAKDLNIHCRNPEGDVAYWSLRNICKNRTLTFEKKCSINEYAMHDALMREQDVAKLHYTRQSMAAKDFRHELGKLLLFVTGPIGTPEEAFATLSRYANGDSLLDYDETTRNTGYRLENSRKIIRITQTPSMGETARQAQEDLIRRIVENRGDMVILSTDSGYKIYNPQERRTTLEEAFRADGVGVKWDARNQILRVDDVKASHIYGHGFYQNVRETAQHLKAKLHEVIHLPGKKAFDVFRRMITDDLGEKTSIERPENFVARRAEEDPDTGNTVLKLVNHLTRRYWQIRERRQYGKQFGGGIDMWLVKLFTDRGNSAISGMRVRNQDRDGEDYLQTHSAMYDFNQWLNGTAKRAASRARSLGGPSKADIQTESTSRTPHVMSLLKHSLEHGDLPEIKRGIEPNV